MTDCGAFDNVPAMIYNNAVLERLAKLVHDRALSYAEVAVACGVGESAVRSWVGKDRLPRNPRIVEFIEKLVAERETAR